MSTVFSAPDASERSLIAAIVEDPDVISGIVVDRVGMTVANAVCSLHVGKAPLGLDSLLPAPETRASSIAATASVVSDSDGRFRLPAPDGHWLLRVQAAGAVPWEEDHLKAGDFRWVRLEKGAEVVVYVRNHSDQALEGCRVGVLQDEYAHFELAAVHAATDPSGAASMTIPSGHWTLAVRHADYRPHFEHLVVTPGDHRITKDVVLSRGIRIWGRVTTIEGGYPPAETSVVIDSELGPRESTTIHCEPDGRFSTSHTFTPSQMIEVAAIAPGFSEVRRELALTEPVSEAESVEVNLVVREGERFARGRVVDPEGRGVAHTQLFVKPLFSLSPEKSVVIPPDQSLDTVVDFHSRHQPQGSVLTRWRSAGSTDQNGAFFVRGLDSRKPYSLLVVSEKYGNTRMWIAEGEPRSTMDLGTVTLRAGGRIYGSVRTANGSPVVGLSFHTVAFNKVKLTIGAAFDNTPPTALLGSLYAVTNREGEFSFEPLPEGQFFLRVGHEQFGPFELQAGETRGPEVLEIARDPRLENYRGIVVTGKVLSIDGAPVVSGIVQLFRDKDASIADDGLRYELVGASAVDAEGEYEVSTTSPGAVRVKAIDMEGAFAERSVDIQAVEGETSVDIVLSALAQPALPVRGVVLGPTGELLAGQKVTLHFSPMIMSCDCLDRTIHTDANGQFDFGPIIAGAHRVVVVDPEGRFRTQDHFPARSGDVLEIVMGQ